MTITVDEQTALWARIEAARRDTSVSRFVGQLLADQMAHTDEYDRARASYVHRQPTALTTGQTPYPARDEIYAR